MNFNLHFGELYSDNSINDKNNLFENYIPKCDKVKRILVSFNRFSGYKMQFSFAYSEGACFYDIWSKDIMSIRRLLECDIQSIRCFISFDVQSTASYCLKLVQKIDRHEKTRMFFKFYFLRNFSTH